MTRADQSTQTASPEGPGDPTQGIPLPAAGFPPASYIRRVAAFLIDLLILCAIYIVLEMLALFVLAIPSFSGPLLYILEHFDRLISAAIALLYFSSSGSMAGGSTPGQRVLRLSVRDLNGQPLHFPRALLRSAFLDPIFLCFGRSLPAQPGSALLLLESELAFGVFGTIVCLLLINPRTGQSLHDWLAGTRVVYEKGSPVQSYRTTPFARVLVATLVAVTILFTLWGVHLQPGDSSNIQPTDPIQRELYQTLMRDPRYHDVEWIEGGQQDPGGLTHKILWVSVTLSPWAKPACVFYCAIIDLNKQVTDFLSAHQRGSEGVTVQTVEIIDRVFFRSETTTMLIGGAFRVTYQWSLLGFVILSSSADFI